MNEHEFTQLVPEAPIDGPWPERLTHLDRLGVSQIAVTLGARGAMVVTTDPTGDIPQIAEIPPVKVNAAATTGCGDAFMGALLHGLATGMTLHDSAASATDVGAFAATGVGAQASYPSATQLAAFKRTSTTPSVPADR